VKSFSIQNFGCRVNLAEAFQWAEVLQKNGFCYQPNSEVSDIVLVNTCTLTQRADRDARRFLKRMARNNPGACLLVTGCFAERSPEEFKNHPQVWKVIPNQRKEEIPALVLSLLEKKQKKSGRLYRSRALVKIQDGCDLSCSFCIIPQVRGKSVSLPLEKVIYRVKECVEQGYREIVLTGIHICLYGRNHRSHTSLLELLLALEEVDGLSRLRLTSLDPRFFGEKLFRHLVSSEKICPHFHFSLQHSSKDVLRRMGRGGNGSDSLSILSLLRREKPFACLGADILVGFPGESEDDFQHLYRFLQKSPLTYFHVFPYSSRPGTRAALWPPVKGRLKKERAAALRELSRQKKMAFQKLMEGKEFKGVVISKNKTASRVLTENYLDVLVPECAAEEKALVDVRLDHVNEQSNIGRIF
jgi:threonylcarbamoyladenosine tRNA methylthiotransferase MtaB